MSSRLELLIATPNGRSSVGAAAAAAAAGDSGLKSTGERRQDNDTRENDKRGYITTAVQYEQQYTMAGNLVMLVSTLIF